jgi:hypothetical protein
MWLYQGSPVEDIDLDKNFAIVYNIENKLNGMQYIGKKLLLHRKTRQVKGKKKKYLAESDWRQYWGSSKRLLEDIETHGEDNFKRTILAFCKSKGEANYLELYHQMTNNVLLDDNYYNNFVGVKIHSRHVKNVQTPE